MIVFDLKEFYVNFNAILHINKRPNLFHNKTRLRAKNDNVMSFH